jgi:hypothetical protein
METERGGFFLKPAPANSKDAHIVRTRLHPQKNAAGGISPRMRAMALAVSIQLLQVRRAQSDDHADFKFLWYSEEHDRVTVWGPSFLVEKDLSSQLNLKIQGVYDVISGASPTGAPTNAQIRLGSTGGSYSVVSGASSRSGTGTTSSQTPSPPRALTASDYILPTQRFHDARTGVNTELSLRSGSDLYTGQIAYSTESDYTSLSFTAKAAREFNSKNTVVSAGVSFNHDDVDVFRTLSTETKDGVQLFLGITQVLDPKTVLSANFTAGFSSGYLSDPYKVALVNGTLMPDNRPGRKDEQILLTTLTRAVDSLNGNAELSYRFNRDSFGISAHTASFAWYQKIGHAFVLSPSVRYYQQSAAYFYAVEFTGSPEFYSADYRLSNCASLSYGLKTVWTPRDNFSVDVAYERYNMWGRDRVTSSDAYPNANIFTVGFRFGF